MTAIKTYTTTHEGTTQTRKTPRSYTHAVWVKESAEKVIAEKTAMIQQLNGYSEAYKEQHAERGYWSAEMVAKSNAVTEAKIAAQIADVMANGTTWGVIGFYWRRDLAEKMAAKYAWMGEIAIATAEATS